MCSGRWKEAPRWPRMSGGRWMVGRRGHRLIGCVAVSADAGWKLTRCEISANIMVTMIAAIEMNIGRCNRANES